MAFRSLFFSVFLAFLASTQVARAHGFDVAIISTSDIMADVLAGFRVATRERDGHAGEESDGHLGGLDVYMLPVAAEGELDALRAQADAADIVLRIIGGGVLDLSVHAELVGIGPPVIEAGVLPGGEGWATDSGAGSFLARFEAEFGRTASLAAAMGYNAARRIEFAVRQQGGVDDRQALYDALDASRDGIDW